MRVSENKVSLGNNRPYAKIPNSIIYKHFLDTNHAIDSSNFGIIFLANDSFIKIAESIFIHELSPCLNGTVFDPSSYYRLNVIFVFVRSVYMLASI